jgi:hypothetical protein
VKRRPWPRYASPGWLAGYAVGLLGWRVILELAGWPVVAGMAIGGATGAVLLAKWIMGDL